MGTWTKQKGLFAAAALMWCAVGLAQEQSPAARQTYRYPVEATTESLSDIYQFARLETEAMLFERLERESKLENVRASLRSVNSRILATRRLLRIAGAFELENAVRLLGNSDESSPQGSARQRARDAIAALREVLARLDSVQQALEGGKQPTAAEWFQLQRLIRVSGILLGPPGRERGLGCVGFVQQAAEQLQAAEAQIAMAIASLPAEDARVQPLTNGLAHLRETIQRCSALRDECAMVVQQLETLRTEVYQSCPPGGEAPPLAEMFRAAVGNRARLEELLGRAEAIGEQLGQLVREIEALQRELDEHTPANNEEREAWGTLANFEAALDNAFVLLWDAEQLLKGHVYSTETSSCPVCGREHLKLMRIPDPVESCAMAQKRVAQLIEQLRSLVGMGQTLVGQLRAALQGTMHEADRRRISLALDRLVPQEEGLGQGLVDDLNVAVERAVEFQKQQFETYPTVRVWPEKVAAKQREWAPMSAFYVAPINWHLPVYFDDVAAERYGNHFGILQPFVSAGKFYADYLLLPYRVWLTPPWQPLSTAGLHRPGDPVPPVVFVPPVDWGATAATVGWWALWLSVVP